MKSSWVKGVSVHHSNSRLVTIHGTSYITVKDSVGFEIFGHSFFIEDGSETNNTLDNNLSINTRQIWTLSVFDVTAANYWVTHPYNFITNNNSAGGEFYGFWY